MIFLQMEAKFLSLAGPLMMLWSTLLLLLLLLWQQQFLSPSLFLSLMYAFRH